MSEYQDELEKVEKVARLHAATFRQSCGLDDEAVLKLVREKFDAAMGRGRVIDIAIRASPGEGPPLEVCDMASMYQMIRNHFRIDVMDARRIKAWRKTAMRAAKDELTREDPSFRVIDMKA